MKAINNFSVCQKPIHATLNRLFFFHTVSHRASSTLNPITKSSGAVTVKTTSGKNKRKKGIVFVLFQLLLPLPSFPSSLPPFMGSVFPLQK